MKIKILFPARQDLSNGRYFYEQQKIEIGDYFFNTLTKEIYSLQIFAGIHVRCGELFRMKSKKFPYLIYYKIVGDIVYIGAVLDARRSPSKIHAREQREQTRMRLLS